MTVELALRRSHLFSMRFVALLCVIGLLAACGDSDPGSDAPATREFTNAYGTVNIPSDPKRIVTTTDQNAMLPLLELGVKPVGSAGLIDDNGNAIFRRTEGFDTSGITHVGSYDAPVAEQIFALKPDLIVGAFEDEDGTYGKLAPYAGIEVFGQSLADALMDFAEVVGKTDTATELRNKYDERIQRLKGEIAGRHPDLTVTFVSTFEPGVAIVQDSGQALGTVAHDLDLGRPAAQSKIDRLGRDVQNNPVQFSIENLGSSIDADVIFVVDYSADDGDRTTYDLIASPIWQSLEAAKRDQMYVIDGGTAVGAAWARMDVVMDILEDKLLAEGLVSTGVNK